LHPDCLEMSNIICVTSVVKYELGIRIYYDSAALRIVILCVYDRTKESMC